MEYTQPSGGSTFGAVRFTCNVNQVWRTCLRACLRRESNGGGKPVTLWNRTLWNNRLQPDRMAACPTGGHCVPRWNRPSMLMFDVNCVDSGKVQKGKFRYETSGALLAGTTLNSSSSSSRSPIISPCESLASMNGGVRGRDRYLQAPIRNMLSNRVGSKSSGYHTRTKKIRCTSTVVVGVFHIQMSSNQAATA